MRFEFHPEALAEYENAAHYYAECQKGLELRFIAAVEHVIQQITKAAEFCRMSKLHLMFELGRLQIPVMNLDDDQIADELRDVALPKVDKPRAGIASEN